MEHKLSKPILGETWTAHYVNAYNPLVETAKELLEALDKEHGDGLGVDTAAAANRLHALFKKLGEKV